MIPEKVMSIIEETVQTEGGFVNDPLDAGGATNFGITQKTFSDFIGRSATADEIENMALEAAVEIYFENFWKKNKVERLPEPLQHHYFDCLVQHGPRNSGRIHQQSAVNRRRLKPEEVDGIVGSGTLAAVQPLTLTHGLIERVMFYANLGFDGSSYLKRNNQVRFLVGWMTRAFEFIRRDERAKVLAEIEAEAKAEQEARYGDAND